MDAIIFLTTPFAVEGSGPDQVRMQRLQEKMVKTREHVENRIQGGDTVLYTLYTLHCTHCTLYTIHCSVSILFPGYCTLYSENCTMYIYKLIRYLP